MAFNTMIKTKSFSALEMAGFGGGGGMAKKGGKKNKNTKLKPKAQWDRFMKMKNVVGTRVGARVNNDGEEEVGEWVEIGKIRSENGDLVEAAVAFQRALIAEVRSCQCF